MIKRAPLLMDPWKLEPARDLGLPLGERLRSTRREGGLIDSCAQFAARSLVRAYLRLYHRFRIVGAENLPSDCPFIMIGNHASHLDAIVMAQSVPWRIRRRMYPIAAGDVFFETPLIAAFAAGIINALPMWRKRVGRHALSDLRTRLHEDRCAYILFPEGRREPDGELLEFKPGVGMLIAGSDIPVVPCFLHGCFPALPRESKIPRPRRITVQIGRPLFFPGLPNTRETWDHIAAECERAVRARGGLSAPAPAP
jgi:1-acyl-sn-glycerol-3-phosphate acyltransferase